MTLRTAESLEAPAEQYVIGYPIVLTGNDTTVGARKFLRDVFALLAVRTLQQWLSSPGTYHINIGITMEKKS